MNDRDLYKAKRIDNKEWITGNYMFPDQIYDYINKIAYRIDPKTLCRCTGLADKNGKLIWENDLMMGHLDFLFPDDVTYAKVEWNGFGYVLNERGDVNKPSYIDELDLKNFEVVYDLV